MDAQGFADRLAAQRQGEGRWAARCPAHDDQVASLTVSVGDNGGTVVYCHAGCATDDVMKAMGLTMADLNGHPHIVASYPYVDQNGNVLYWVNRWAPKNFTCSVTGLRDADRVLYRLPLIEHARQTGETVFVTEGEKDADRLVENRVHATTAMNGANSKWLPQYTQTLAGLDVVVVADNDKAGLKRAREVYAALQPVCASVALMKPSIGKDISDLYDAGYDISALEPIAERDALTMLDASEVQPKDVAWAWNEHIPFGSLTLIDGDPGSAKSTLTCDLVARWTRTGVMPDGSHHAGPFNCIMVSAEDDPEATIVPRLVAANADLRRVKLVIGGMNPEVPFSLGVDFLALHEAIRSYDARVLVLDPLTAFLPSGADTKMDADVRRAIGPLAHMARQMNIAVVVVRHLTKSATSAMYAGSGSVGFIAAARSAFLVTHDPVKGKEYRVLAPIKSNLAPMPKSLSYTVEPSMYKPSIANVLWHGEVVWDAQNLMDAKAGKTPAPTKREDARGFIEELFGDKAAEGITFLSWEEVVKYGKQEALSEHTLRNARIELQEQHRIRRVHNPMFMGERLTGHFWELITPPTNLPLATPEGEKGNPSSITPDDGKWQVEHPPKQPADAEEPPSEDWLRARPAACDYPNCPVEGDEHVFRFGDPYWCVRCIDHMPPPPPEDEGLAE